MRVTFAVAVAVMTAEPLAALEFTPENTQVAIAPKAPGPVQFAAEDTDLSTSVTLPAIRPAKALRSVTVSVTAVSDEFVTNP